LVVQPAPAAIKKAANHPRETMRRRYLFIGIASFQKRYVARIGNMMSGLKGIIGSADIPTTGRGLTSARVS
jgi:hypothetical protein